MSRAPRPDSRIPGVEVIYTDERVRGIRPAGRFRWKRRAERCLRRNEQQRRVWFYRWEIQREGNHYIVVAMQNLAAPRKEG